MESENICIACGSLYGDRKIVVPSDIFDEEYTIRFCSCGLGKTESKDDACIRANAHMYDDVLKRVDIYLHYLRGHMAARYKQTFEMLREHLSSQAKILEIGSNIGYAANVAMQYGYDVVACEINDGCRNLSADLYNLKVKKDFFEINESYDAVVMFDVLEHFKNPDHVIKRTAQLLSSNGILYIQLPNVQSQSAKIAGRLWPFYCVPDHTYHFTVKSLSMLLEKNGLKIEKLQTVSFWADYWPIRMIRPKRVREFVIKIANIHLSIGFKKCKGEDGTLIQVVARKL